MGDHYYSEKPTTTSSRSKIEKSIDGHQLQFYVDRGVFSKSGVDFGTQLLIETIEAPSIAGAIADVGCGWGPIGITLAKKYPDRKIVMVDVNERAIELANMNAQLNGVGNVEIFRNDLLQGQEEKGFAAIITNPPIRAGKEIVFRLYEQGARALFSGGELWIVIQKKQGAPSTKKKLEDLGLEVEVVKKSKGYFIFKGKKS